MEELTLGSYGKLNLTLAVTGRQGHMHVLDTIMASVDLFDVVTARKSTGLAVTSSDGAPLPNAQKAARLMAERFSLPGAEIIIECRIPSGRGLGGSSADAAGAIRALDALYELNAPRDELEAVAAEVGSDVPFMLYGGVGRLRGTALGIERLRFVGLSALVASRGTVSTAEAFRRYDEGDVSPAPDCGAVALLISDGECGRAVPLFGNALTAAAEKLNADIAKIRRIMTAAGLKAVMTGSGSAVAGYGSGEAMEEAKRALEGSGYESTIVHTSAEGCVIRAAK